MVHRWAVVAWLSVVLVTAPAWACVGKGARTGDFAVEDTEGAAVRFSAYAGRTILILYEDRVAVDWNAALKKRLTRDKTLPRTLVVLPVADMRRWKFWPARTFAQKELRKRSKAMGRPLFGDWNGEAAKALGVVERTSSVILFGEDGVVRWAGKGRLSAERIDELVALIRGAPEDGRARPKDPVAQVASVPPARPAPEPAAQPAPEPAAQPGPEPAAEPAPEPAAEPAPEPLDSPDPEPPARPAPEPLPVPSRAPPSPGSSGDGSPR